MNAFHYLFILSQPVKDQYIYILLISLTLMNYKEFINTNISKDHAFKRGSFKNAKSKLFSFILYINLIKFGCF